MDQEALNYARIYGKGFWKWNAHSHLAFFVLLYTHFDSLGVYKAFFTISSQEIEKSSKEVGTASFAPNTLASPSHLAIPPYQFSSSL